MDTYEAATTHPYAWKGVVHAATAKGRPDHGVASAETPGAQITYGFVSPRRQLVEASEEGTTYLVPDFVEQLSSAFAPDSDMRSLDEDADIWIPEPGTGDALE